MINLNRNGNFRVIDGKKYMYIYFFFGPIQIKRLNNKWRGGFFFLQLYTISFLLHISVVLHILYNTTYFDSFHVLKNPRSRDDTIFGLDYNNIYGGGREEEAQRQCVTRICHAVLRVSPFGGTTTTMDAFGGLGIYNII